MSTSGITGGGFSQLDNQLARTEQFNTDSKQVSALKNGNVAADPEDFVTLSTATTASSSASSTTATTSETQDFQTLGEDLESGNLAAALQALAQIELGR